MKMKISPRSLWVVYAMSNVNKVEQMLPEKLTVLPAKIYDDDSPAEPRLMFNLYDVHSRFVKGKRVDIQTLALHEDTGRAHLVILDVLSTTHDWNPMDGLIGPNAVSDYLSEDETIRFGIKRDDDFIHVDAQITPQTRLLDERFAVEGNLMCFFKSHPIGYEMTFDEDEIMMPVKMISSNVSNSLWSTFRCGDPTHVFMHPHPMTFDVDLGIGFMSLW